MLRRLASSIPNMLTVLRLLAVVPFVILLLNGDYIWGLLLLMVAGLTDVLDGYLARHFGWYSWFGSVADPLADKVFLVACYVLLGYLDHIPMWLVYTVLGRDVFIVSGSLLYWYSVGSFEGNPTLLGKACTLLTLLFAIAVLLNLTLVNIPPYMMKSFMFVIVVLAISSALQYFILGIRKCRGTQ